MAAPLTLPAADWAGEDVSVAEILHELGALRQRSEETGPELRTNVMTHMAWIPLEWAKAAAQTLEGLAERHPSRTLLLLPQPEEPDGLDASVSLRQFALEGQERRVSTEVIELRLRGGRATAPGSIVWPLLISDLPVFCRWRGEPPWGGPALEQLVDATDRLVVDSREWAELSYDRLAELFGSTAISDIAWARTLPWRRAIAELWPRVAELERISVRGPRAEASLLAGWLRSRLRRDLGLELTDAEELQAVAVDDEDVPAPRVDSKTPSDLLSEELDHFGRDIVYEDAAVASTN